MKKIIITAVAIILLSIFLFGCSPALKQYDQYISEIRSNLFEGKIGDIKIDAITGYREEPFEINGSSDTRQSFTVITIYPTQTTFNQKYTYIVQIDGVEYTGQMVKHPFNNTYSAEIGTVCQSMQISVTLNSNEGQSTATLTSVISEEFIDSEKALSIALKKLNSGIRTFKNNQTSYEIYIRLLENPISSSGGYHWYVAFVGENDVTYAVLIDPISLDIVAIRE